MGASRSKKVEQPLGEQGTDLASVQSNPTATATEIRVPEESSVGEKTSQPQPIEPQPTDLHQQPTNLQQSSNFYEPKPADSLQPATATDLTLEKREVKNSDQEKEKWDLPPAVFPMNEPIQKKLNDNNLWTEAALKEADIDLGIKRTTFSTRVRILVTGKAGAGKSVLIAKIFSGLQLRPRHGAGAPLTTFEALDQEWAQEDLPIVVHDSQGFELQGNIIQKTMDWVRARESNPERRVHIIWHCVPVSGGRFEQAEAEFIEKIGTPVFVILTKRDNQRQQDEDALRDAIHSMVRPGFVRGVFRTAINPEYDNLYELRDRPKICGTCENKKICLDGETNQWFCPKCNATNILGPLISELKELIESTCEALSQDNLKQAFMAAQSINVTSKLKKSLAVIIAAGTSAGVIGVTPLPFIDPILLIPLQLSMISGLGKIWEIRASLHTVSRLFISQIIAQTFIRGIVRIVGSLVGVLGGNAISGVMAAVLTLSIGIVYTAGFCKAWQLGWRNLKDEDFTKRLKEVVNPERAMAVMARIQTAQAFTAKDLMPLLVGEVSGNNPEWTPDMNIELENPATFYLEATEIHDKSGSN